MTELRVFNSSHAGDTRQPANVLPPLYCTRPVEVLELSRHNDIEDRSYGMSFDRSGRPKAAMTFFCGRDVEDPCLGAALAKLLSTRVRASLIKLL